MIEQLAALSTILLSISLATERLITIIKTIFPMLADEQKDSNGQVDYRKDKLRRLLVQCISFLAGWTTATFLSPHFDLINGHIKLTDTVSLHVVLVGFLSMGGSAFWSSILGYAKAVKDIRQQQKNQGDIDARSMATRQSQ